MVLAPATSIDPSRAFSLLTLAAGVALAEGIEQAVGLRVDLKWPNDLLVSGRKVGGILAESGVDARHHRHGPVKLGIIARMIAAHGP